MSSRLSLHFQVAAAPGARQQRGGCGRGQRAQNSGSLTGLGQHLPLSVLPPPVLPPPRASLSRDMGHRAGRSVSWPLSCKAQSDTESWVRHSAPGTPCARGGGTPVSCPVSWEQQLQSHRDTCSRCLGRAAPPRSTSSAFPKHPASLGPPRGALGRWGEVALQRMLLAGSVPWTQLKASGSLSFLICATGDENQPASCGDASAITWHLPRLRNSAALSGSPAAASRRHVGFHRAVG